MKKVVEEYYCDDCEQRVEYNDLFFIDTPFELGKSEKKHFCLKCVKARVTHSLKVLPNIQCPKCNGKGSHKDYPTYGSDFNIIECQSCKGSGRSV